MSKNTKGKNTYKHITSRKSFGQNEAQLSDESLGAVSAGMKFRSRLEKEKNDLENTYDCLDGLDNISSDLGPSCLQMLDRLR